MFPLVCQNCRQVTICHFDYAQAVTHKGVKHPEYASWLRANSCCYSPARRSPNPNMQFDPDIQAIYDAWLAKQARLKAFEELLKER